MDFTNKPLLKKAYELVSEVFKNQVDKAGKPYIGHLTRVKDGLSRPDEIRECIALMHDLFEDYPEWTPKRLQPDFPQRVIDALILLHHKTGVPYMDYIEPIKSNLDAEDVKISDLRDNLDTTRLPFLIDEDMVRIRKYHNSYIILSKHFEQSMK